MRILFLDQFSASGGAQLCLNDVLDEVRRRGWDAEVMAPGDGPLLQFARECGFAVQPLPISQYANGSKSVPDLLQFGVDMARSARAVSRVLRERPVDLIYVNGPRALPAIARARIPVLFHSHSPLEKRYARVIARWSLRGRQTGVLACCQFVGEILQPMLPDHPVRVIYNGVLDQGFRRRPLRGGPLRVGILGRIAPEKGHLDFLRAAQLIGKPNSVQFVVIGAALFSDPEYERSIHSLGAAAGVEFRGWTGNVSQVLHDLEILAVPSASNEASPRVIMEAMSAGTCVIAYPSGGIPELIRNGYSGLLTDSCSYEALARGIQTLIENPNLRAELAANARTEVETRFTVERFRREVCDLISAHVLPAATVVRSTSPAAGPARDGAHV